MSHYKYSDQEIKIAEWVGFKFQKSRHFSEDSHWTWPLGGVERFPRAVGGIPHFNNDDGAAVLLLPMLMEKYKNKFIKVMLESMSSNDDWFFTIGLMEDGAEDYHWIESEKQSTIAQAITAAVMKLIESI
jgi:hypothetical protein